MAVWAVALIFGLLGFLMRFHVLHLSNMGIEAFWLVSIGFLLLLIAPLVKGM
jgi:hypothetical protein